VAEQTPEARIRDLERRLDLDPGSRLFVSVAEEYRKLGRLRDALSALQKGLLAHPGYVAAQVALGRVYLEANQTTDAIATFTKVLVADPGNLVAAKSLADIQLARGDKLEAVKKYKLYRALSGDRKVDPIIAELETQVAPKPVTPPRVTAVESPPPPPSFQETDKSRRRAMPRSPLPATPTEDPFELTSVPFEMGEDSGKARVLEGPFLVPTRDVLIAPPEPAPAPPAESGPAPAAGPSLAPPPVLEAAEPVVRLPELVPEPERTRPTGRALADLYYAQGHYAEALQIYDDLVSRHPFDEDLKRLRRDAEARLLPAGSTGSTAPDPGLERRLARIRALKDWLAQVQAG
jgi:tetratricopeptide (TPR) repeat protein